MATKETRSSLPETTESPKKKGRKSESTPTNPKLNRKRKQNSLPSLPRTRRIDEPEEPVTPVRSRKSRLEHELGDLLDFAAGRNTPTFPRTKKNDREDGEDHSGLGLLNRKTELDDDMMSVRSFSGRGRRGYFDDDIASLRGFSARSKKNNFDDDTASLRSFSARQRQHNLDDDLTSLRNFKPKPVKTLKTAKKKDKEVVEESMVKKKMGRPKKIAIDTTVTSPPLPAANDDKPKRRVGRPRKLEPNEEPEKKVKRAYKKRVDKGAMDPQKRTAYIKKKILMRTAMKKTVARIIKKQKATKKLKAKLEGKGKRIVKKKEAVPKDGEKVKPRLLGKRKRLSTPPSAPVVNTTTTDVYSFSDSEENKKVETDEAPKPKKTKGRPRKVDKKEKVLKREGVIKQRLLIRKDKSIHFESKRSPSDDSVIIVQPRLGPRLKRKSMVKSPELPPQEPIMSIPVSNYQLISKSTPPVVPKFKNPIRNPNFNPQKLVGPDNLPYIDKQEEYPPMIPNELILTPSGIVQSIIFPLSSENLVYPAGPFTPSVAPSSPAPVEQRRNSLPAATPERLSSALPSGTEVASEPPELRADVSKSNAQIIWIPENLPRIPVAKTVSDLFMLKERVKETNSLENGKESEKKVPVVELKRKKSVSSRKNHLLSKLKGLSILRRNSESKCEPFPKTLTKANSSMELSLPKEKIQRKRQKPRKNVRRQVPSLDSSDVASSDPETWYQSYAADVAISKWSSSTSIFPSAPIVKPHIACTFSDDNKLVVKELLGIDSDAEPELKTSDCDQTLKLSEIKTNVDNVLKETPHQKLETMTLISSAPPRIVMPITPPTVIDKLLERNKSLKKAEEECQAEKGTVHEVKKNLREFRTKKSLKIDSTQQSERRGSNPEIYKSESEMMPLRRLTNENIQHVIRRRRLSLPLPIEEKKTEARVINITTGENGSKDIHTMIEELDKTDRRISCESSSSSSESFNKIIEELNILGEVRKEKKVPYNDENVYVTPEAPKQKKQRLSADHEKRGEEFEDLDTNKETLLSALGLQSLKAAAQNKKKAAVPHDIPRTQAIPPIYQSQYTGTLKTVIRIDKKGNSKMYKSISSVRDSSPNEETHNSLLPDHDTDNNYSREGSEEGNSDENKSGGKAKSLVIPEKASSFSIHPGRMCSDVCTYCFGKFGLLDTPCHVAQLKDSERRRNILMTEIHLTADSCLCDACFRHVDKKSNCPTFTEKKYKKKVPGRKHGCCAHNCNAPSVHQAKRKLFMKLKKSIGKKLIIDQDKLDKLQNCNVILLCEAHNYWLEYYMNCGICKRRLSNVNMYKLGIEVVGDLNQALSSDGIPTTLTDKRFLCKLCRCYALLRVKVKDPADMSPNHRQFYENCRKRILYCHGIEIADSEDEPSHKNGKMKHKKNKSTGSNHEPAKSHEQEIPRDIEMTLEKEKDHDEYEEELNEVTPTPPTTSNANVDLGGNSLSGKATDNPLTQIHVKLGNLNIGALSQEARCNNRPDVSLHQCFPTENELPLRAKFDFNEDEAAATTERQGFERVATTMQFNAETRALFKDLQTPYGNQSSFMRHLILLEKYFRNGDLVVSRQADNKAVNYLSSIQNRIRSYEGMKQKLQQQQQQKRLLQQQEQQLQEKLLQQQEQQQQELQQQQQKRLQQQELQQQQKQKEVIASKLKSINITPSVSIVPHSKSEKFMPSLTPIKTERGERPPSVSLLPTRPFTITPMPSTSQAFQIAKTTVTPVYSESPLSQMQASVQNISGIASKVPNLGNAISVTSVSQSTSNLPPKPEVSILSLQSTPSKQNNGKGKFISLLPPNPFLTSKIQENLKNLASHTVTKSSGSTRAVLLNRTVGGQKQSLVQVTTGGKKIHLTLPQFKRIQQMQMRKKQYLEHQAKLKQEAAMTSDDVCPTDNLEVEIQELPTISEVRSLSDSAQWDMANGESSASTSEEKDPLGGV